MIGYETDAAAQRNNTLNITLEVNDPECVHELQQYVEGAARDQFARSALRIGILALKQARGHLDGETVRREGDQLMASMKNVLTVQLTTLNTQLQHALKEYFDPQSGRFQERVQSLVKKDGELETVIKRLVGGNDSELCKTLAIHFGHDSTLMKILSPKESEGLLKSLSDTMNKELATQRDAVLNQFSLDRHDSALSRLVVTLTNNHGDVGKALQEKIDTVMKEFSLDKEDSALKRMTDGVTAATKAIHSHLTLDEENSALSRVQRELKRVLEETAKSNQEFQKEVRETLVELRTRRQEALKTTKHGTEFEREVFEALTRMAHTDLTDFTKDKIGLMKGRKVGDVVVEIGPEAVAAGAKIVFEAKDEAKYTMAKARLEIEEAKTNRGSNIGVFVFAKRNAPTELEPFRREGDNLFVIWDEEDPMTDIHLQAGLEVGRALCTRLARQRNESESIDIVEFEKSILEIERVINALDEINTMSDTIKTHSDKIKERVRITRTGVERQLTKLNEIRLEVKSFVSQSESAG